MSSQDPGTSEDKIWTLPGGAVASLGWAVAVLPRVLVSTEESRFGGHASGGPITHVMVSFVGASTGLTSQGALRLWAPGFPFSSG